MSEVISHDELIKLWDENRADFIKLYSKEHQKPLTLASLDKAFVDIDGNQIYQFPTAVLFPINRFGKQKEFIQWLDKGLTKEEDKKIDNALAEIILNGKDLLEIKQRCGGIFAEKELRREMVTHTEIFYNLLALELVREDENPEVFDNDIHMEKVKTFKRMTKEGSTYFFFQKTALPSLSRFLNYTQEEWDNYWNESLIRQQLLPEILSLFTYETISTKQKMTSKSN